MQNNCRIGNTYFIYSSTGYVCHIRNHIKRLSDKDREIHEKFIEHLEISGKIDKSL